MIDQLTGFECEAVKTYTANQFRPLVLDRTAAGERLDELARDYASKNDVSYSRALNAVLEDETNAELKHIYGGTGRCD